MNTQGTDTALVQRVRTFADDVRRAKAGSGVVVPTPSVSVQAPMPSPVPKSAAPQKSDTVSGREPRPNTAPREESAPIKTPVSVPPFSSPIQPSHLSDEQKPLDIRKEAGEHISPEGTIITDTRRKRWTLTGALGESLGAWFDEQKNAVVESTIGTHTEPNVPPVETRARTLQAAREKSTLAPKDDRHVLVEKLRTFASDAKRATGKTYTVLHTGEKAAPSWSSASETSSPAGGSATALPPAVKQARKTIRPLGGAPLQAPKNLEKDVAPAAAQSLPEHAFVERNEKEVVPIRPGKHAPLQYGLADDVAPLATNAHEEEIQNAQGEDLTSPDDRQAKDAREAAIAQLLLMRAKHTETEATFPSRDTAFTPPAFATAKTTNIRTYRNDAIEDVEKNKRSIPNIAAAEVVRRAATTVPGTVKPAHSPARPFIIASAIMIFIMVTGSAGFFWYIQQSKEEHTTSVSIPTFIAIDTQKAIPFSTNRATLLQALEAEVRAAGPGITQLYPEATAGSGAVSTDDFMYVLDPRAPGSFLRNLSEEMMFGSYNDTAPFFIFKTKQFDTVFAGMLDWEKNMSVDLTPLFGTPVTRTLDTTIRTVDQTRNASFVDDTLRNTDVRILYDEAGKEGLLYGFPDKNTLVVTTSSAAFIELIERLQ